MLPNISNIKRIRTSLNITQKELSNKIGISQSYLTKIETQKANPPYNLIKKIFNYLDSFKKEEKNDNLIKAINIMTKNVKCVSKNNSLNYVLKQFNEFNISQMPVIEDNIIIGSINNKKVAELISKNKKDINYLKIKDIINPPYPLLDQNTNINIISKLLLNNEAIILTNNGKLSGIITSFDLNKIFI